MNHNNICYVVMTVDSRCQFVCNGCIQSTGNGRLTILQNTRRKMSDELRMKYESCDDRSVAEELQQMSQQLRKTRNAELALQR